MPAEVSVHLKPQKLGTDRKDQLTSWTHSSSRPPRCGRVPVRNDDCVTSSRFENNTRGTRKAPFSNLRGNKPSAKPREGDRQLMVEPDGIEPTTSCLQSRRSPN